MSVRSTSRSYDSRETATVGTATDDYGHVIKFQDVLKASAKIQGIAYKTPVMTSTSLNELANDRRLFFKVEALQRTGSFKFRGALNATLCLVDDLLDDENNDDIENVVENKDEFNIDEDEYTQLSRDYESQIGSVDNSYSNRSRTADSRPRTITTGAPEKSLHIVTHSSGNHAAAVALAADLASDGLYNGYDRDLDVRATIVMPKNAPDVKVAGVKGYGGEIVMVESTNKAREQMANYILKEKKAAFIHPSENPKVIAGQGTVCLEFVDQVKQILENEFEDEEDDEEEEEHNDLDVVIIPVGGGGLAAGNAIALRGLLGDYVRIVLAEPANMDDAKRSKDAGELLGHDPYNPKDTVADGLKTTLGPNTWPVVRDLVDDIITVSEEDILRATKLIWDRLKICIEPSAGTGFAVALSEEFQSKYRIDLGYENVGIILCGGNVEITRVAKKMYMIGL